MSVVSFPSSGPNRFIEGPETTRDAVVPAGLLVMLGGIIVMAFLIGDLSNIMSNLDPVANEFKQTLDNLNDYMHRSGFDNDLRLKLREYIMLSEPCFRDHFNKEMLTKLSPTNHHSLTKQPPSNHQTTT